MTSQSHHLAKKIHHSNGIKLQKVQECAGSAVGDISIHKGAIQGVTGQTKLIVYNVFDG